MLAFANLFGTILYVWLPKVEPDYDCDKNQRQRAADVKIYATN